MWRRVYAVVVVSCVSSFLYAVSPAQADTNFANFQFQVESFTVSGNSPGTAVDNFDDGVVSWIIEEQTAVESGGVLTLSTPGVYDGPFPFDDFEIETNRASVRTTDPSDFDVVDGAGNFTATSQWASGAAAENQFYGMALETTTQSINFNMINFKADIAGALGVPSGLGIWFYDGEAAGVPQAVSISASEITGDVFFRLSFDDSTNEISAGYSLDGGGTWHAPFTSISSDLGSAEDVDWYLEAEELRVVPAPDVKTTQIIDSTGDGAGNTLDYPNRVAVDSGGNVYVAGYYSDNAFKIATDGTITEIIDAAGDGLGNTLGYPSSLAVDSEGNVYVAGGSDDNVFKIATDGTITQIIYSAGDRLGNTLNNPKDVAVDSAGNVYVTGSSSDNAFKIATDGTITQIIDSTGDGNGNTLDSPKDVAVDSAGNVYVTGYVSYNVFKIATDGTITEIIDVAGDGLGNTLRYPSGLAVDSVENVYVTGYVSYAFKIATDGTITQIIDSTGDGTGNTLDGSHSVAVDSEGNVYVTGCLSDNAFKVVPEPSAWFLQLAALVSIGALGRLRRGGRSRL